MLALLQRIQYSLGEERIYRPWFLLNLRQSSTHSLHAFAYTYNARFLCVAHKPAPYNLTFILCILSDYAPFLHSGPALLSSFVWIFPEGGCTKGSSDAAPL